MVAPKLTRSQKFALELLDQGQGHRHLYFKRVWLMADDRLPQGAIIDVSFRDSTISGLIEQGLIIRDSSHNYVLSPSK